MNWNKLNRILVDIICIITIIIFPLFLLELLGTDRYIMQLEK